MGAHRMFGITIIDSDAFLDMPTSTQCLYFHLGMRADDDGFVNSPKKVARMIGAGEDDLKLLIAKNFLIPFDTGVVAIKHWKLNNLIRADRSKPTVYQEELAMLTVKENGVYTLCQPSDNQVTTKWQPNDNQMTPQDKVSKDKVSKVKSIKGFIKPTLADITAYCQERGNSVDPQRWLDYYEANGWKVGKNPMKDWKACVRTWERNGYDQPKTQPAKINKFTQHSQNAYDFDELESLLSNN